MKDRLPDQLAAWARAPEAAEARADAVIAATLAALPAQRIAARRWPWAGAALAAGLAAAAVLGLSRPDPASGPPAQQAAAAEISPADTFALMFVPTPEEEEYL